MCLRYCGVPDVNMAISATPTKWIRHRPVTHIRDNSA